MNQPRTIESLEAQLATYRWLIAQQNQEKQKLREGIFKLQQTNIRLTEQLSVIARVR